MGLRKKKTLIEQASDYVDSVRPQIESAVTSARDAATEAAKDARERAMPLLAEARDKAAPVIADARDKAAPVIAAGAAVAAERASQGASLAAEKAAVGRDLAAAKLAEVTGKPQPKKSGKLRKLLLVTGLAALGGFIFSKVKGGQTTDNWQSSYVPTPPPPAPVPTDGPTDGGTDDVAGASPDEAVADATDTPHPVSTPDDPAETVTIDEDAARRG